MFSTLAVHRSTAFPQPLGRTEAGTPNMLWINACRSFVDGVCGWKINLSPSARRYRLLEELNSRKQPCTRRRQPALRWRLCERECAGPSGTESFRSIPTSSLLGWGVVPHGDVARLSIPNMISRARSQGRHDEAELVCGARERPSGTEPERRLDGAPLRPPLEVRPGRRFACRLAGEKLKFVDDAATRQCAQRASKRSRRTPPRSPT